MTSATPATGSNAKSLTRWIYTVMWGSLVVPALSFVLIATWAYQKAVDDARAKVSHASALTLRQADRIFDVARTVAALADEATQGTDAEVRANEKNIQQRFSDLCAGLGFVVNMNVWSADGRALVRSDHYPVDASESTIDRRYFSELRDGPATSGISEVLVGRHSGRELFNLTRRRQTPDGRFNGIVAVSLSPESFRDYYRSLASDEPDLASFALIRDDGVILARWPIVTPVHTAVDADNPVFLDVRAGASEGVRVVAERDGRARRLISYRRVPGWPVYVTAGVSNASVIGGWLRFTGLLLAVFLPITAGLLWVSWIALGKTREEQRIAEAMRHEIQRRAQAEKTVVEGQKLQTLAQLTGGVAHDFNNLLTIVSNNLHILARRHPELAHESHLASVFRAIRSGARLTRQLLSFSRKQALRPERVDLRVWLKDTEGLVRSTLASRTTLHYDIAPDTRPISVDLAELELALINTALNAQHAMAGEGSLRIIAKNADRPRDGRPMVVVCVEDSGEGIAPELLTKVFEPFFTTKAAGKGSGLGLSQVAGLCDQAGGYADLESVVGRGTVVRMHFPALPDEASTSRGRSSEDVAHLTGTVLLVEDNVDVASVTEQLLRTSGLDVVSVPDSAAALATMAARASTIDLLLSDISMPGPIDGLQLARTVVVDWPSIPVVLMTGYADKIHDAIAEGFRVLAKPMDPTDLLTEIGSELEARGRASSGR